MLFLLDALLIKSNIHPPLIPPSSPFSQLSSHLSFSLPSLSSLSSLSPSYQFIFHLPVSSFIYRSRQSFVRQRFGFIVFHLQLLRVPHLSIAVSTFTWIISSIFGLYFYGPVLVYKSRWCLRRFTLWSSSAQPSPTSSRVIRIRLPFSFCPGRSSLRPFAFDWWRPPTSIGSIRMFLSRFDWARVDAVAILRSVIGCGRVWFLIGLLRLWDGSAGASAPFPVARCHPSAREEEASTTAVFWPLLSLTLFLSKLRSYFHNRQEDASETGVDAAVGLGLARLHRIHRRRIERSAGANPRRFTGNRTPIRNIEPRLHQRRWISQQMLLQLQRQFLNHPTGWPDRP